MNLRQISHTTVLKAILCVAVLLRLGGMVLNTEANDDHMTVIRVMAYEHRIPAVGEYWESYQPKLYHGTVALIFALLPKLSDSWLVRIAQGVSCTAGILTLLLLYSAVRRLPVAPRIQQLSYALTALNPKMLATSIQATNDAFVILFATVAFSAGYRFFRSPDRRSFLVMTVGAMLAGVSKGNGMAVTVALGAAFVAAWLWSTGMRLRVAGYATCFIVAVSVFVAVAGEYWSRYQTTGNPFTINEAYMQAPHFFEETFVRRPGITSVANSFLTFRLAAMLQEPQITNDVAVYPAHRTSFWSAVYGSMHSIHYDYFPPSWQTHNPLVRGLLRVIFLLALVPTGILIYGLWRTITPQLRNPFSQRIRASEAADLLLALGAAGYLAFLVIFAYHERDFGSMKPIYLFPGVLPVMVCCAAGFERLRSAGQRRLSGLATLSATVLCLAYLADELALMIQLTALRLHLL
jgi:hypothetical protein